MQRFIAIDNVCAWPNLTRLPDGAILVRSASRSICLGGWRAQLGVAWSADIAAATSSSFVTPG